MKHALIALVALVAPTFAQAPWIWISPEELQQINPSGPAWTAMYEDAQRLGPITLSNQDDKADTYAMAAALVAVRLQDEPLKDVIRGILLDAVGSEVGGRTLALGRNLTACVIAGQLVGMPPEWKRWLSDVRTETLDGKTLISTHEERPNNWGTHAGAARLAIAVYLEDWLEVQRCSRVFRGWLGERAVYSGFEYGDLDWQATPAAPVGINAAGSTKDGHSIDGVLPDDQRRAGGFQWPPPKENYVYEALQGVLVQAVIFDRLGRPGVWSLSNRAIKRAFVWLDKECQFPAEGDDTWEPFVVNRVYRLTLPTPRVAAIGKSVGYTDWTTQLPSWP